MKPIHAIATMLLLLGAGSASPAEDERERHYREGTAGVSVHALPPGYLDGVKRHNDAMEAHLKEMESLMRRIQETRDAGERRKLLDEHGQSMRQMMAEMRSSSGEMKMGIMSGGPRSGEPMPEGERLRQHLLEKRIDLLDMMMEQVAAREVMLQAR